MSEAGASLAMEGDKSTSLRSGWVLESLVFKALVDAAVLSSLEGEGVTARSFCGDDVESLVGGPWTQAACGLVVEASANWPG